MTVRVGAPIWIDLTVTDIAKARAFYGELLNWSFDDRGSDWGGYHIITIGGKDVGGAVQRTPEMNDGSPDAFAVYLRTDDAEATAARAEAAGGSVVVPPMRVGDQGTMLGLVGPDGAFVGAWQPEARTGYQTDPGELGGPSWFELMSTDFGASRAFYAATFGHDYVDMAEDGSPAESPDDMGPPDMGYATNGAVPDAASGLCNAAAWLPEGSRSYWRIYVQVADTDASVDRVRALGGSLLDGPIDSPFGRVATVADDQGVSFQVISALPRS